MAPYTDPRTDTQERAASVETAAAPHAGPHGRTLFQQYTAVGRFLLRETMRQWRQRRRSRTAPSEHTVLPPVNAFS
jgi:hypothetical protein